MLTLMAMLIEPVTHKKTTSPNDFMGKHDYIFVSTNISIRIQWNLSIMDTLGTIWSVLIKEVSQIQRLFSTLLYVAGIRGSVLIREVSSIQRFLIERFCCIYLSKSTTCT